MFRTVNRHIAKNRIWTKRRKSYNVILPILFFKNEENPF
jgi:hypothetical protein